MVVGERQVAHRADADGLVAVLVLDHDRALDDRAGAQHRSLRRHQDRGVEQGALATDVGDREGATGQLVRLEATGAGTLGDVGDRAGQAGQRQVARVVDDRREQALLGVDRDAQVLGSVVRDLLGVLVVARVHVRVNLECLDDGLREERQERQVDALALGEVGLRLRTQRRDPGDVDLEGLGQLSGALQRFAGLDGRDLTDPVDLLRGATQVREFRTHTRGRGGGRSGGSGGGCSRSGGGSLGGVGGGEDVLLADASTDARARDLRQVDVVVGGELAHERGDVRRVVGRLGRCGGRCGSSSGGGRCGSRSRSSSGGSRGGLGCGRLGGLGCGSRSGRGSGRRSSGADDGELAAHVDDVVLLRADLEQHTGDGRRDLGVDLVRRDLEEGLVDGNLVTDGLEPAGDGALGDRLAQLRHRDRVPDEEPSEGAAAGSAAGAGADSAAGAGVSSAGAGVSSAAGAGVASAAGAGVASAAGASPASPITASSPPMSTTSSSCATIFVRTPAAGDGISVSTLSVETSSNGSSTSTVSPSCLSHRVTVPSVTDSPRAGIWTEKAISFDSSTVVFGFVEFCRLVVENHCAREARFRRRCTTFPRRLTPAVCCASDPSCGASAHPFIDALGASCEGRVT
ncbi:ABC transporter ATPase [Prescottella equi NBRC 101255 = C 7]|nr:ABC transporter ATPase [Prescottella equi NBRC 101255 = C 7]